jgi:uncharacterized protein
MGNQPPEQAGMRIEHHVLWHCALLASSEYATLRESESGYQLRGLTVLPRENVPCHVSYEVSIDREWYPFAAIVVCEIPSGALRIALSLIAEDRWAIDGTPAPRLLGCRDLDLGWTPVTNTIPIRRLGLPVGGTARIMAAWIRFPELDIVPSEQRYTRLADERWRYQSGDYDFELRVHEPTGVVLKYGDDLWHAAAGPAGTGLSSGLRSLSRASSASSSSRLTLQCRMATASSGSHGVAVGSPTSPASGVSGRAADTAAS